MRKAEHYFACKNHHTPPKTFKSERTMQEQIRSKQINKQMGWDGMGRDGMGWNRIDRIGWIEKGFETS